MLADTPGMIGRIARGWLRIGFALDQRDGVKAAPEINPDTVLLGMAGYFYDKPLAFVFLGAIFTVNGVLWCLFLAWAAARVGALGVGGRAALWLNRGVGALFVVLGVRLALARQT